MAANVVLNPNSTYGASISNQRVSRDWTPVDQNNIDVRLLLTAVTETTGITFKLQESYDDGAHWWDVGNQSEASPAAAKTFDGTPTTGDIDGGADTITITTHGFSNGDRVIYSAGGGTAPTGLTSGSIYYIIDGGVNTIQLATTQQNAYEGIAIDLTDDATGASHTLTNSIVAIRMVETDSSDQAQLPVQQLLRVVVSSGASDSVQVGQVWIKD